MPPPASSTDWEMNLVMPLGVLGNQLVKIEGELRFLSMKAAENYDGVHSTKAVDARLELIHDVLGSIYVLLAKLQADLHPKGAATQLASSEASDRSVDKRRVEQDD